MSFLSKELTDLRESELMERSDYMYGKHNIFHLVPPLFTLLYSKIMKLVIL